jgi:hypothetical protein
MTLKFSWQEQRMRLHTILTIELGASALSVARACYRATRPESGGVVGASIADFWTIWGAGLHWAYQVKFPQGDAPSDRLKQKSAKSWQQNTCPLELPS